MQNQTNDPGARLAGPPQPVCGEQLGSPGEQGPVGPSHVFCANETLTKM